MPLQESQFTRIANPFNIGTFNGADITLIGYEQEHGDPPSPVVQTSKDGRVSPPLILAQVAKWSGYGIEYYPRIGRKIDEAIGRTDEIPPLPEALKKAQQR
jgi:hypothetical protein